MASFVGVREFIVVRERDSDLQRKQSGVFFDANCSKKNFGENILICYGERTGLVEKEWELLLF